MITRRLISMTALNLVAMGHAALAQSAGQQEQFGLPNRGAPTGRVGAATRRLRSGSDTDMTLELAAPQTGIGLSSSDQPTLCYLISGRISRPLRFVLSLRNQPRPVADLELDPPRPPARLGAVRLHDRNIRLAANQLYVWSVAVVLDSQAPSHDLVASALVEYRPIDPARSQELRQAVSQRNYSLLGASNYWYDAVALAEESRSRDGGAGLEQVLEAMGLSGAQGTG